MVKERHSVAIGFLAAVTTTHQLEELGGGTAIGSWLFCTRVQLLQLLLPLVGYAKTSLIGPARRLYDPRLFWLKLCYALSVFRPLSGLLATRGKALPLLTLNRLTDHTSSAVSFGPYLWTLVLYHFKGISCVYTYEWIPIWFLAWFWSILSLMNELFFQLR
ncbi:hypothetical protein FIBSPDRAFT_899438 [Athelia psychrophila]|uniref:Uncharacterized protein n=1 Tax=Athelia psychrophila TaxID=1759441 RepID=A0A165ZPK0_9AGAM|nr:hypothetical protein FIBSPDRAFT_899438 [Fibularhizoctonia sp. CBS 109695]